MVSPVTLNYVFKDQVKINQGALDENERQKTEDDIVFIEHTLYSRHFAQCITYFFINSHKLLNEINIVSPYSIILIKVYHDFKKLSREREITAGWLLSLYSSDVGFISGTTYDPSVPPV